MNALQLNLLALGYRAFILPILDRVGVFVSISR